MWIEQIFKYLVDSLCKWILSGLYNIYDVLRTAINTIQYFNTFIYIVIFPDPRNCNPAYRAGGSNHLN